jgi:hypothetical protein
MRKVRIVRRALAVVVVLYVFWLAFTVLSFKRYVGPRPGETAGGLREWEAEGVYHVHTRFSDGRASADSVAAAGAAAGLDFVILTDHGAPNEASLAAQGRKSGILLLAGSELSTSRGHLAALGFERPARPFSQNAEEAAGEIDRLGGFSIIAHPYSKTHWSWGDWAFYGGIEVFNGDTSVKKHLLRSLLHLPALLLRPEAALLPLIDPPAAEMAKWQRLAAEHPVRAYFAADAHFAYGPLFRLFHIHALLDAPLASGFEAARAQIFAALKDGRFYNAIEAAAAARGFRFWAERRGRSFPMGSTVAAAAGAGVRFVVRSPYPFAHETRLLRDGAEVGRTDGPSLSMESSGPGVYRAEVYLRERTPLDRRVPWIVSNPIVLERQAP